MRVVMTGSPNGKENFEINLAELQRCAGESVPVMVEAMDAVVSRWPSQAARPTFALGDSPGPQRRVAQVFAVVAELELRQRQARDAVAEMRRRLTETAAAYREADRLAAGP